jgi:hypothetical protein
MLPTMSAPTALLHLAARSVELATLTALIDGEPHVRSAPGDNVLVARSLVPLGPDDLGREVAIAFIGGDRNRPIILGLLHAPEPLSESSEPIELELDGHQVAIQAATQLTLRCGKASITLDADGRIVIKGAQILTQASGSHRIRGSSIQLN